MDSPASSESLAASQEDGNEYDEQHEEIRQIPSCQADHVSSTSAVLSAVGMEVSEREPNTSESKPSDTSTVRPHFKDQVRGDPDEGRVPIAQGGSNSIPLAQSVHIVVGEEDLVPDSAMYTQPAEVLPTYPSGINAIVETFKNQPEGAANPPGIQSEDSDTFNPPNSQQIALQKHKVWASSFLLAVVVIAVAVAVAVIMTTGGGSLSVEPSTEGPSTLVSTNIPLEPTTDVPTFRNTLFIDMDSEIKLVPSDGAAKDNFGNSVAIEGDTIVIGASTDDTENGINSGSAYVYTHSGTIWTEQAILIASDGAAGDNFGWSVAIDGNIIVIGARFATDKGVNDTGIVYVYTYSETVWTEQAKLTASTESAEFGVSVAIDRETIVLGAHKDDEKGDASGSAYVYTLSGSVWTEQAKITASDGAPNDRFGVNVAIDGDTIVIGARSDNTEKGNSTGGAYIYTLSETVWTEQAKLTATDGAAGDRFGNSVAVNGDTIVIGAFSADTDGLTNRGKAYVYTRSGAKWEEQFKLTGSDTYAMDYFGKSAAIYGDTVVIGVSLGGSFPGRAYVYGHSGTLWSEQAKITASDGAVLNRFSTSVALNQDTIVVGASGDEDSGSAYVYSYEDKIA